MFRSKINALSFSAAVVSFAALAGSCVRANDLAEGPSGAHGNKPASQQAKRAHPSRREERHAQQIPGRVAASRG
jgi:hypothetical protein